MAYFVISRLKDSHKVAATDVRRFSNFGELYKSAGSNNHMSVAPLKYKMVTIQGDNENLLEGIGYQGFRITQNISKDAWEIIQFQLKAFSNDNVLHNTIGVEAVSYAAAEAIGRAFANDCEETRNYKFSLGDKAADITDVNGNPMQMTEYEAETALREQVAEDRKEAARARLKNRPTNKTFHIVNEESKTTVNDSKVNKKSKDKGEDSQIGTPTTIEDVSNEDISDFVNSEDEIDADQTENKE